MLTSKRTRKRPTVRPSIRRVNKIKIDLEEASINMRNWIDSAQDKNYGEPL